MRFKKRHGTTSQNDQCPCSTSDQKTNHPKFTNKLYKIPRKSLEKLPQKMPKKITPSAHRNPGPQLGSALDAVLCAHDGISQLSTFLRAERWHLLTPPKHIPATPQLPVVLGDFSVPKATCWGVQVNKCCVKPVSHPCTKKPSTVSVQCHKRSRL